MRFASQRATACMCRIWIWIGRKGSEQQIFFSHERKAVTACGNRGNGGESREWYVAYNKVTRRMSYGMHVLLRYTTNKHSTEAMGT